MVTLEETAELTGYTVKQLLNDVSYEFLVSLINAKNKIKARRNYYQAILPRLSDESIKDLKKSYNESFEDDEPEPLENAKPQKPMTIRDLEAQARALGIKVKMVKNKK